MSDNLHVLYNRAQICDRQVNELIGLARGIVADQMVNQAEAESLLAWLVANQAACSNPVISTLMERIYGVLSDGVLDSEEAAELLGLLNELVGGNMEIGEALKATNLPLDTPPPKIIFEDRTFCFTGTFAFGSRRECEAAVTDRGGKVGSVNLRTNYLVIGAYATMSWAHSAYGRKIEKAVDYREGGKAPIAILGESYWVSCLR